MMSARGDDLSQSSEQQQVDGGQVHDSVSMKRQSGASSDATSKQQTFASNHHRVSDASDSHLTVYDDQNERKSSISFDKIKQISLTYSLQSDDEGLLAVDGYQSSDQPGHDQLQATADAAAAASGPSVPFDCNSNQATEGGTAAIRVVSEQVDVDQSPAVGSQSFNKQAELGDDSILSGLEDQLRQVNERMSGYAMAQDRDTTGAASGGSSINAAAASKNPFIYNGSSDLNDFKWASPATGPNQSVGGGGAALFNGVQSPDFLFAKISQPTRVAGPATYESESPVPTPTPPLSNNSNNNNNNNAKQLVNEHQAPRKMIAAANELDDSNSTISLKLSNNMSANIIINNDTTSVRYGAAVSKWAQRGEQLAAPQIDDLVQGQVHRHGARRRGEQEHRYGQHHQVDQHLELDSDSGWTSASQRGPLDCGQDDSRTPTAAAAATKDSKTDYTQTNGATCFAIEPQFQLQQHHQQHQLQHQNRKTLIKRLDDEWQPASSPLAPASSSAGAQYQRDPNARPIIEGGGGCSGPDNGAGNQVGRSRAMGERQQQHQQQLHLGSGGQLPAPTNGRPSATMAQLTCGAEIEISTAGYNSGDIEQSSSSTQVPLLDGQAFGAPNGGGRQHDEDDRVRFISGPGAPAAASGTGGGGSELVVGSPAGRAATNHVATIMWGANSSQSGDCVRAGPQQLNLVKHEQQQQQEYSRQLQEQRQIMLPDSNLDGGGTIIVNNHRPYNQQQQHQQQQQLNLATTMRQLAPGAGQASAIMPSSHERRPVQDVDWPQHQQQRSPHPTSVDINNASSGEQFPFVKRPQTNQIYEQSAQLQANVSAYPNAQFASQKYVEQKRRIRRQLDAQHYYKLQRVRPTTNTPTKPNGQHTGSTRTVPRSNLSDFYYESQPPPPPSSDGANPPVKYANQQRQHQPPAPATRCTYVPLPLDHEQYPLDQSGRGRGRRRLAGPSVSLQNSPKMTAASRRATISHHRTGQGLHDDWAPPMAATAHRRSPQDARCGGQCSPRRHQGPVSASCNELNHMDSAHEGAAGAAAAANQLSQRWARQSGEFGQGDCVMIGAYSRPARPKARGAADCCYAHTAAHPGQCRRCGGGRVESGPLAPPTWSSAFVADTCVNSNCDSRQQSWPARAEVAPATGCPVLQWDDEFIYVDHEDVDRAPTLASGGRRRGREDFVELQNEQQPQQQRQYYYRYYWADDDGDGDGDGDGDDGDDDDDDDADYDADDDHYYREPMEVNPRPGQQQWLPPNETSQLTPSGTSQALVVAARRRQAAEAELQMGKMAPGDEYRFQQQQRRLLQRRQYLEMREHNNPDDNRQQNNLSAAFAPANGQLWPLEGAEGQRLRQDSRSATSSADGDRSPTPTSTGDRSSVGGGGVGGVGGVGGGGGNEQHSASLVFYNGRHWQRRPTGPFVAAGDSGGGFGGAQSGLRVKQQQQQQPRVGLVNDGQQSARLSSERPSDQIGANLMAASSKDKSESSATATTSSNANANDPAPSAGLAKVGGGGGETTAKMEASTITSAGGVGTAASVAAPKSAPVIVGANNSSLSSDKAILQQQQQQQQKPVKLKNLLDDETTSDHLHLKYKNNTKSHGCTETRCLGSLINPKPVEQRVRTAAETWDHAREFIDGYYTSIKRFDTPAHKSRLAEIEEQIKSTDTYYLRETELIYGAKLAWRNAPRCIGRIQWSKLQVFDARFTRNANEMFEAICNHIKYATNKGSLRSAITIFPQRVKTIKNDWRVWNPQLIGYAGYRDAETGKITGDPINVDITDVCLKLGWKAGDKDGQRGRFDVLPIVLSANGGPPQMFHLPDDLIMRVKIKHPKLDWFQELGLEWYALPAVSGMMLDVGGLQFTACPFSGWYMVTEIGSRDLADTSRYNMLEPIAQRMGLNTTTNTSLWRDQALTQLNLAVLDSFQAAGVTIVDHHTACETFMTHLKNEQRLRGGCPADWVWLVPPTAGSTTQVYHQEMVNYHLLPNYEYLAAPWKNYDWQAWEKMKLDKKQQQQQHLQDTANSPASATGRNKHASSLLSPLKISANNSDSGTNIANGAGVVTLTVSPFGIGKQRHQVLSSSSSSPAGTNGSELTPRHLRFKEIARAVKFTSKLFGKALSRRIKATILYATETGKSERFANKLAQIFSHAFNVHLMSMSDYDMTCLEHEALLLIVTSTFGNGDPPENGELFAKHLAAIKLTGDSSPDIDSINSVSTNPFFQMLSEDHKDGLNQAAAVAFGAAAADGGAFCGSNSSGCGTGDSGSSTSDQVDSGDDSSQNSGPADKRWAGDATDSDQKAAAVALERRRRQQEQEQKQQQKQDRLNLEQQTNIRPLSNVRFAVFALGSTAYPHFCAFGRYVDQTLGELGAERILKCSCGDELCGQEKAFNEWSNQVFKVACDVFCLTDTMEPIDDRSESIWTPKDVKFVYMDTDERRQSNGSATPSPSPVGGGASNLASKSTIIQNLVGIVGKKILPFSVRVRKDLHAYTVEENLQTICVDLDSGNLRPISFKPGDHIGIYPVNKADVVDRIIKRIEQDLIVEQQQHQQQHQEDTAGQQENGGDANNNETAASLAKQKASPQQAKQQQQQHYMDKRVSILVKRGNMDPLTQGDEWIQCDTLPITSIREALTRYLDITNPPNQDFLSILARQTNDAEDKKRLQQMARNFTVYEEWKNKKVPSLLSVLDEFRTVKFDPALITQIPPMKPRFYSVSGTSISLTLGVVRYKTQSGELREGLCSNYLNTVPVDPKSYVYGYVRSAPAFHMPQDKTIPMLLISAGTGIAPFRAFWQQRHVDMRATMARTDNDMVNNELATSERAVSAASSNGVGGNAEFGCMDMYFGCRNSKYILYKDELDEMCDIGVISSINVAFSRPTDRDVFDDSNQTPLPPSGALQGDRPQKSRIENIRQARKKMYVQDKMFENGEQVFKSIMYNGAHIYVCGDVAMADGVYKTLAKILNINIKAIKQAARGSGVGLSETLSLSAKAGCQDLIKNGEDGESILMNLRNLNRYHEDIFGAKQV